MSGEYSDFGNDPLPTTVCTLVISVSTLTDDVWTVTLDTRLCDVDSEALELVEVYITVVPNKTTWLEHSVIQIAFLARN